MLRVRGRTSYLRAPTVDFADVGGCKGRPNCMGVKMLVATFNPLLAFLVLTRVLFSKPVRVLILDYFNP